MKKLQNKLYEKKRKYLRRKIRTNKLAKKLTDLPRLIVNRSNKFIYVQVVDSSGKVLATGNDLKFTGNKTQRANEVGLNIGKSLLDKKIERITFDRNGYIYHGRVRSLAEGVRKAGIKF